MTMAGALDRGRGSFGRHAWGDAFAQLSDADRETNLEVEDLERLAVAAYMVGRDDDCADAWTRAHHGYLRRQDPAAASRCAFWQALGLFFRGDMAPAMGWVARGRRVLEGAEQDYVEQGWLLFLTALPVMFGGDPETAHSSFAEAGRIADRFADPDVMALSRLGRGQSLIMQQQTEGGMALLDELMVAVTSGEVSPIIAGIAYCAVIDLCHTTFDLRRAREWTAALSRWCDSQPDLVPYRGNCLVHRCEIFRLQGAWPEALEAAERACQWLSGPAAWDSLGSAYYQLGEIRRLRGELAPAEDAYRRASRAGREPEPGMSLLRLAQRRANVAVGAIRRVVAETHDPLSRCRVLPAYEELGAASDLERVAELMATAARGAAGGLSPREVEVLALVASGKTNRAIAAELFLSEKTVARHVSNIFTKLELSSRSAATAYAYQHGLV